MEQDGYRVRFEWGPSGLRRLAPVSDVVVIVDVLSFTTAVDVALGRGGAVLPYRWHDGGEQTYAAERDAVVAGQGAGAAWTLAPATLVDLPAGVRLVLPSPNGSALSFGAAEAGASTVLAGCLRNASAVGAAAGRLAGPDGIVSVIAAGERWNGATGPLRPALEDLLGAGAILAGLEARADRPPRASSPEARSSGVRSPEATSSEARSSGVRSSEVTSSGVRSPRLMSPEARIAIAAFEGARSEGVPALLHACGSGVEKAERGQSADVDLAADFDVSAVVPLLADAVFVDERAVG